MNAPQIAVTRSTPARPRRIPPSVRQAILGHLEALELQVLTDAEFADDIARTAIDAWEAIGTAALTVDRHPGGGWYWDCTVDGTYCACGSWTNWYGWPTEINARDEGRIHLAQTHDGRGLK